MGAYINLSGNDLNGDISTAIGGWSRLETLQLSRNNFDIIPSSLKDWKVLKHFDISENDFDGPIPNSLALPTQLVSLNMAGNDFTGTIPSVFGNMTSLESLFMYSNDLDGSVPKAICSLRDSKMNELLTATIIYAHRLIAIRLYVARDVGNRLALRKETFKCWVFSIGSLAPIVCPPIRFFWPKLGEASKSNFVSSSLARSQL